ncbi:hypothetical protein, partial [uncultured Prochlorococcus sp.]|uniref:hypothetical protein n=1 Tax=uncultured Prochlorococcus sp. TaxID=159733 RepID=UPI0025841D57
YTVVKPFLNILYKKNRNLSFSKNPHNKKENHKSKPLIISGFILSSISILLLLFTISSKFE